MRRLLDSPFFLLPARWFLGGFFLVAAAPKLLDPAAFALAVDNYHFLPSVFVNLGALVLPWVELLVGLILLLGPGGEGRLAGLTEAAAALSALMYLSFFIALASVLIRGYDISCGCFNPVGTEPVDALYLVRDGGLFGLSLLVYFRHAKLTEDL